MYLLAACSAQLRWVTLCEASFLSFHPSHPPAGLLLFTASACGSIALHQLHERFRGHKDAALSTLLACFAALYGAAAVRLQVMCGPEWAEAGGAS